VLYGREEERAQIWALLEAARASRSGVLVVRGEAGIGKSALLEDARDRATDMHVLRAWGVESESELPFAALHQLLRPALSHVDRLPAPQAAALSSALGLRENGAGERFLVFAACLTLLSELAERRPVLCLVDDAHWLDASSSDALQFVARRLEAEGIAMLFAAREGDVRSFAADGIPSLAVGGLEAEAASELLGRRARLAPAVRDRLLDQTRGNALALVELPATLTEAQLAGDEPLPEALPMTRQLEAVFHERVSRLPEETRRVLLLAAADDSEDVRLLTLAADRAGANATALDAAEEAKLVNVRGTRLEFRHPLVRSAVYVAAPSSERRAAHRALAEALAGDGDETDRRAWHLAAATVEHDEGVVQALEEAAERAIDRAGHMAAARAFERAAELSANAPERGRRLVRAASAASVAGRNDQAVALADRASPLVADPALRADLAQVYGVAAIRAGRPGDVVAVLVDAARGVAPVDPAKAIALLSDASIAAWQGGEMASYLELAALAAEVAPRVDEGPVAVLGRSIGGFAAMIQGDTETGVRVLRETVAWGEHAEEPLHVLWAGFASFWLGDAERFGTLVERTGALARRRGELGTLADALGMRAAQLAFSNRFDEATAAADEGARLARELNAGNLELLPLAARALTSAIQGRDEEARRDAETALDRATANGLRLRVSSAVYALALVELGRARWAEALALLDSLLDEAGASLDPMTAITAADKLEAAVRAGKIDEARATLPLVESWAGYSGTPWAAPRLALSHALLTDGDEATGHFEAALSASSDMRPFELARLHLLYGEHLRRERRRRDARSHLREALEGFERLRAAPWTERARAELRASGETARKRDPSTVDQLTPQELQISRYVAEGLTNKEIAAQLFLSPRTIDSHLRNVFAKLGITSRTQLVRLPLDREDPVAAG
jgi:DNA-binding CsgD family transcriptional regulator